MDTLSFADWLMEELTARDLSQSDLSRKSGLTTACISGLISGFRKPAPDSLVAIARALIMPPETLFRIAGLLPRGPVQADSESEFLYIFKKLNERDQEELIEIARMKLSRKEKTPRNASHSARNDKQRL